MFETVYDTISRIRTWFLESQGYWEEHFRVRCPACGLLIEDYRANRGLYCKRCRTQINTEQFAAIVLQRIKNQRHFSSGRRRYGKTFDIAIDRISYGTIKNRETVVFAVPFGTYQMRIKCGLRHTDVMVTVDRDNPLAYLQVYEHIGLIRRTIVVKHTDPTEMSLKS